MNNTKSVSLVVDGNTVTIDTKLFQGYVNESHGYLRKEEIEKENFKLLVETISETTKLEKKHVSKYLKSHFKATTKLPKAEADLFEKLDEVVGT